LDISRLEELDRNDFFVGACKDATLGECRMSPGETAHADLIHQFEFLGRKLCEYKFSLFIEY
jgi:hypothetical protein